MRIKVPALLLFLTLPGWLLSAAPQGKDLESLVRAALPVCPGEVEITSTELDMKLPAGFSGRQFNVTSSAPACGGRYIAVVSPRGSFFLGSPWPIGSLPGTPAERIRQFALRRFDESFQPVLAAAKNEDGLVPVQLLYNTEYGKVPMPGVVDAAGTTFFPGFFFPAGSDFPQCRLEKLSSLMATAPARGPAGAPVSVIEFSDFQCPSCKAAAGYIKPLLDKYSGRVRYTRIDYPLVSSHPWAFGAALIGRAIYQQNPDAFWKYKDAVYENQANLNLFTLEDFGRGFAADHQLDMEKFNAALSSEAIRKEIIDSIAGAYALQVFGTPTFLVNGEMVFAGVDGKNLEAAIDRAIKP